MIRSATHQLQFGLWWQHQPRAKEQAQWLELLGSPKFRWILFKSAYFLLNSPVLSLVLQFPAGIFSALFGPEICGDLLSFGRWVMQGSSLFSWIRNGSSDILFSYAKLDRVLQRSVQFCHVLLRSSAVFTEVMLGPTVGSARLGWVVLDLFRSIGFCPVLLGPPSFYRVLPLGSGHSCKVHLFLALSGPKFLSDAVCVCLSWTILLHLLAAPPH